MTVRGIATEKQQNVGRVSVRRSHYEGAAMKTLTICFLMMVAATLYAGSVIKSGTLQARSDGNNVTIQWGSTDESNVKEYGVERRSVSGGDFMLISTVKPKGSNSYYEFVDQSAFKTTGTMYQYRIRIVDLNSGISYSDPISVSHNVSGVKRTWGSLKAMFR